MAIFVKLGIKFETVNVEYITDLDFEVSGVKIFLNSLDCSFVVVLYRSPRGCNGTNKKLKSIQYHIV